MWCSGLGRISLRPLTIKINNTLRRWSKLKLKYLNHTVLFSSITYYGFKYNQLDYHSFIRAADIRPLVSSSRSGGPLPLHPPLSWRNTAAANAKQSVCSLFLMCQLSSSSGRPSVGSGLLPSPSSHYVGVALNIKPMPCRLQEQPLSQSMHRHTLRYTGVHVSMGSTHSFTPSLFSCEVTQ